jgi:hypothetical protein
MLFNLSINKIVLSWVFYKMAIVLNASQFFKIISDNFEDAEFQGPVRGL